MNKKDNYAKNIICKELNNDIIKDFGKDGFIILHKSKESFRKMCHSLNEATRIFLGDEEFYHLPE